MGRLAGFSAGEVIRKLRRAGFVFDRQAKGSHEIGGTPLPEHELPLPIILATCREALCELLSARQGLT